jgi:hypothetical protein
MAKPLRWSVLLLVLVFGACSWGSESFKLEGVAEDLWGDRIDLAEHGEGLVFIQPFSPANCGYCLVDGLFVKRNYFDRNPGASFHQCLFNPQRDIYCFIKHYREGHVPVLTFPFRLHDYHRNGFPFLIAFRDGEGIYQSHLLWYDKVFTEQRDIFWPGQEKPMIQTSPVHMASLNCYSEVVVVVPDNDEDAYEAQRKYAQRDRLKELGLRLIVRYEKDLTEEDLAMNLEFKGSGDFRFDALRGEDTPIAMEPPIFRIGSHTFSSDETGLCAFFPNPRNPEAFVKLNLLGKKVKQNLSENCVDYTVFSSRILLHGFFDKTDPARWKFSQRLAFGEMATQREDRPQRGHSRPVRVSPPERLTHGKAWTLGTSACRFPDAAVDSEGTCWVTWEEEGDILLTPVDSDKHEAMLIESNESDSYDPLVAHDGSRLWVFYLNDGDGFYRIYGRFFDGTRLSNAIQLTDEEPFDAITPAVTGDRRGRLVLAWSEWRANQRFLKYRLIENGKPNETRTVSTLDSKDLSGYVDAWYPSLVMEDSGRIWGAWNQHYPAILGVCAGDLEGPASSVSPLRDKGESPEENGGYPSAITDENGRRWVFWESFAWTLAWKREAASQSILSAYFDEDSKAWSSPVPVNPSSTTQLNQTPCAVVDDGGVIWAAWSGRPDPHDLDQSWGIYLSRFKDNAWSPPDLISGKGINSRAPDLAVGKDGAIWITWHAGAGDAMKVKVLQLD